MLNRFLAWCKDRADISRAQYQLSKLSERDLHDMGISRADIPRIVSGEYVR